MVIILAVFLQNLSNIFRMRQGLLVSDYVDREIHDRAISVSLRYYESPEYYDALERAREGGTRRPAQIVANTVIMFRAAITIIGIFVLIGTVEYRLLPVLLIPIFIALTIRLHFARKLFNWRMSRAQKERRASYLDWVMTHTSHAKDLRINGIGPFFRNQYSKLRRDLRNGEIKIEQARLWAEFSMAILGAAVFIAASSWLLYQSLEQSRPIGDVVLFVLLLRRAESAGNELVGNISKIVDDHLYLQRLFDFFSVPSQTARPSKPLAIPESLNSGLQLSDVTFRYDGANKDALKNVSLRLDPGKIVALVGENGSGKTTLIKLLTRLYDPTTGVVSLNGIDIREFDPALFRKQLSVVFQDYAAYAESVAENIRFGDITREASQDAIETAAKNSGASQFISSLPQTYQTPLTKLFDNGQDLSIGQWQRLALARALYPHSRFIILDEPTSAMDPKAEFELFENFRARINGKGALIISHRLSTVRQADFIYVLEDGKIVEQGTHDELMSTPGQYSSLFQKQSKYYK
ncbi:MAG: ABC transporter ATP-binding protein [Pseudomonadota bacterium]